MSNKIYTSIPAPKVPRNEFKLSRPNTFSTVFHRNVPTALLEILPGDRIIFDSELFARLQPMIAPVFNQMRISQHAFYVPFRTINRHFAEFMFNNPDGSYTDVLPYLTLGNIYSIIAGSTPLEHAEKVEVIRLLDFIGLPFVYSSNTSATLMVNKWISDNAWAADSTVEINLGPFFAYAKIYTDYYRDQNLEEDPFKAWVAAGFTDVMDWSGNCDSRLFNNPTKAVFARCFLMLRKRAWAHDRFTSALPFAQRGPDVLIPVAGSGPVTFEGVDDGDIVNANWSPSGQELVSGSDNDPISATAELSNLSTTINEFRTAERLQRFYENSARGGTRPNEATLAHWGVRTKDATLDRAEFLGGQMQPLVVSEVEQNSETTSSSPLGTLAGKATSYKPGRLFKRFFDEHGFVIVLTSAMVRANYSEGLPKVFSRREREEYAWPEFANLGEEPIFLKELSLKQSIIGEGVTPDDVFGYVPRYSDYKSAVGEIHGDFRSSLAFWTQNRKFANPPALNKDFIYSDPDLSPFAVANPYTDLILCTANYHIKASRLLPFYGVPTL